MRVEVLDKDKVKFEREGSEMGQLAALVMHALTWVSIGACFHIGWRIVG